jgi:hypothetical protein
LNLDLEQDSNRDLLKRIKKYPTPNLKEIRIYKAAKAYDPIHDDIQEFLNHSFPKKVREFYLYNHNSADRLDLGEYENSLAALSDKISIQMCIYNFSLTQEQFKSITESHCSTRF